MVRPRREVTSDPLGYGVAGGWFITQDRALAAAVAAELDRLDPLPCLAEHDDSGEWVDISDLGQRPRRIFHCCGKREDY